MKSYLNLCIGLLLLLNTACSVTIPMAGSQQSHHNNAQTITQPYFQKKTGDKRPILTGIGVAAGAGLFYHFGKSTVADANGVPYTPAQINQHAYKGAALGTLAGLLFVGGMIAYNNNTNRWLRPKTTKISVTNSNFDAWLTAYNKKNSPNYIKYRQEESSYLLVPNSQVKAYQAEEDRLDDIAYNRVINGESGSYIAYLQSRSRHSKNYQAVVQMETEYTLYERAMDSQLREGHNFNDMLLNCNTYMYTFPNGNKIFQDKVVRRIQDIKSIPESVRKEKEAEIARQVQEARLREKRQVGFFLDVLELFINSSGSKKGSGETTSCTYCYGSGRLTDPDNGRSLGRCPKCNGTGKVD